MSLCGSMNASPSMIAGTSKYLKSRKKMLKSRYFSGKFSYFSKQISEFLACARTFTGMEPVQSKPLYVWCDILEMLLQQQCLGGLGV